jgi:RNA polymerase sigma-70 factor (ECF subfamily)
MDDAIARLYAAGRARWPAVAVEPDAFAAYAAERAEAVDADLYLACACASGSPEALATFDKEIVARIPDYVARIRGAAGHSDEISQRVRAKLLVAPPTGRPKIADYGGRGPLGGWVRVVAVRAAHDLLREGAAGDRLGADDDLADRVADAGDVEMQLLQDKFRAPFEEALRTALADLSVRERNLLKLHFVDGLNIDRIGVAYGVHRATVARWLAKARADVLAAAERRLGERAGLSPDEVRSLVKVVRSQLQVSVVRLLAG